ncbi:MAG TPA: RsmB/NOP family class I SAM-dependent RNA methyltransferase [Marmoricola sp.]|nr:RsmB/NOP family class I SAM-dependent RNA methyltransferase [Marmoricola sp.]
MLAFRVLRAVDAEDAYANLALAAAIRDARLSSRDAGLATELVSGTLRRRGTYEAIIRSLVNRPLDPAVRDVLCLGAHQLLNMRVPQHAAVATSVALARSEIGHRITGLVNAVLRKVGQRSLEEWLDHLNADPSVRYSHPTWIVDALAEALGSDPTPILEADNESPRVCLVARPGQSSVEELLEIEGASRHPSSPIGVEISGGDPGAVAAIREGRAGVQDAGSQVVALALAAADVEANSERWLDMCSGPGGKASLLGALAVERGAFLVANERAPHRAALVGKATRRLPKNHIAVIAGDGTRPAWADETFDRVLVDAPCSGLGALRRRPESRWRRQLSDIVDLVPLQKALLTSAIAATTPGGVIAYATCSPVLAETVEVVQSVLVGRDDVILEDASELVPWLSDAKCAQMPQAVQLWPHIHRTDAMFLAVLRRTP